MLILIPLFCTLVGTLVEKYEGRFCDDDTLHVTCLHGGHFFEVEKHEARIIIVFVVCPA